MKLGINTVFNFIKQIPTNFNIFYKIPVNAI